MRQIQIVATTMLPLAILALADCNSVHEAPDVEAKVHQALSQAGMADIEVSQDREKAVVTLRGTVPSTAEKERAEVLAKPLVGSQVLANEIVVLPPGNEDAARAIQQSLDRGIENNLDAALLQASLRDAVDFDVRAGVVTLHGSVAIEQMRGEAQRLAVAVPNVQQVVNELDVITQKATSTK